MARIVNKKKRSSKQKNPLMMFFFVAFLAAVTFTIANSQHLLNYLSRAGVGSNINIVFVNQDGSPIHETRSAFVNVKLTSPWGITNANQDVKSAQTSTFQVSSSADDVNQDGTTFSSRDRTLWVGNSRSTSSSFTGLRFNNISIPKGAKITSAYLQVYSSQSQWVSMKFAIGAHNTSNSPSFSNSDKPSDRQQTLARVGHQSNERWNSNRWYDLNDISPVVQEIVSRNDWQSGNSVSIILKGTGGSWGRKFTGSFDQKSSNAPKLVVSYETSGTTTVTQAPPTATATTAPQQPTSTKVQPTPIVTTDYVELAEDPGFTKNYVKVPYVNHPLFATYSFTDATPGKKTIYARFHATNNATQVFSNWIDLTALPTSTPVPTTPPTGGGDHHGQNSHAMGAWKPNVKYDTCSTAEHDSYKVMGPDGKWYPTWHPPVHTRGDGTTCTFGHEHGRDPHESKVFRFLQETYGYDADSNGKVEGAELATAGVPFGYVNEQLDIFNTSKGITNGMRHEDHVGHKIEWENNLMRQWSTSVGGGSQQRGPDSGVRCDFFMKIHQGTHSKDAFTNNMHELIQGYECTDGIKMANAQMVLFGRAGGFTAGRNAGSTPYFQFVGEATPQNSPSSGSNVIGRAIGDIDAVVDHILVPQGSWSLYSDALYEDWISGSYVRTANGTQLAYFDPHFAVFGPSRFFWSGNDSNSYGITRTAQDKADNVGRSVDTCFMTEKNGAEKARGGECESLTNYGKIKSMAWDDPRSHFNGVKREFYFNNMGVSNTGSNTVWYSDPFGNNAQTTPFVGSVKHYLKPKNTPGNYQYPFESNAIGGDRWYGGNGVHAPN